MDGKGCYSWNDTHNVYLGQWLKRNRHGHGVYVIVTRSNTNSQEQNEDTPHTLFKFICGKWKDDCAVNEGQFKFIEAW